ncbi:hypothetical protein [Mycobacterium sp. DL592]|uniref:hypothetical protein n=1 Tax=Mycobacterium sp. DL592 TaxID=2675524 RepID=UPI00141E18AD|nr:hypothetical protein [Mycobacterium sp. DL592]
MNADVANHEQLPKLPQAPTGRYRTVLLTILAVAAVAAVGLLGVLTYYTVTDHIKADEAAAEAKRTEVDKTQLVAQVTNGLQGIVDKGDATKDFHITIQGDLELFQLVKDGSEYKGLVTAKTQKGTDVPVEVTAYADGSGAIFYQIEPGSLIRLTQTASEEKRGWN